MTFLITKSYLGDCATCVTHYLGDSALAIVVCVHVIYPVLNAIVFMVVVVPLMWVLTSLVRRFEFVGHALVANGELGIQTIVYITFVFSSLYIFPTLVTMLAKRIKRHENNDTDQEAAHSPRRSGRRRCKSD